jgi:hypothetical protein
MQHKPRTKELEYYSALSVLERVKFIKISKSDATIMRVGFSDIITEKVLLDDAIAFWETGALTHTLAVELLGPILADRLSLPLQPSFEVTADDYAAMFEAIDTDADTYENDTVEALVEEFHLSVGELKSAVEEKLQVTSAVLNLCCKPSSTLAEFLFLPQMLLQTPLRTLSLYCRAQDKYNAVHDLAEHFMHQQLRLHSSPKSIETRVESLHLKALDTKNLAHVFEETILLFEKKYRSEQRLRQEIQALVNNEARATRQQIFWWMRGLMAKGFIECAPLSTTDPLMGRFLRFAEASLNIKVFGTDKYPFTFTYSTLDTNDDYKQEVARLKRKIEEVAPPEEPTAKRRDARSSE